MNIVNALTAPQSPNPHGVSAQGQAVADTDDRRPALGADPTGTGDRRYDGPGPEQSPAYAAITGQ